MESLQRMTRLVLFDIDATILKSGGAGRRAMERAFAELYGLDNAFDGIVPDGNTDPLIFREILRMRVGEVDDEDAAVRAVGERYLHYLSDEMTRSEAAELMPGVVEVLEGLAQDAGVTLGLLTGNLERGARIKLARFDLNRFFDFGAFSSDDEVRRRLVPIAVRRAEARCGDRICLGSQVLVVGDSPLDVACALANGATAVAVATGRSGAVELARCGAHIVFDDLSNPQVVLEALLSE
jgi:phosphoglycolate phosphatase-like HAD superfamily hydrolase